MSKIIGPLIINIDSTTLQDKERDLLSINAIGSVILFAHNYISKNQVKNLITEIKNINSEILISVDHEGGRIQRFKDEFTILPSFTSIGNIYDKDKSYAKDLAYHSGYIAAYELKSVGVDINFSPVVDLTNISSVLHDRTFSKDSSIVIDLATKYIQGHIDNGIIPVIKHYPGHGTIENDSHHELCICKHSRKEMEHHLNVFLSLSNNFNIPIMTSHIQFTEVCENPATTSATWLKDIPSKYFRNKPFFISDDIEMLGLSSYYCDISSFNILDKVLSNGCSMAIITSMQKRSYVENKRSAEYIFDEYLSKLDQLSISKNHTKMICHDDIIYNKGTQSMYNNSINSISKFNEHSK
mgnify:CR=1 FL=1